MPLRFDIGSSYVQAYGQAIIWDNRCPKKPQLKIRRYVQRTMVPTIFTFHYMESWPNTVQVYATYIGYIYTAYISTSTYMSVSTSTTSELLPTLRLPITPLPRKDPIQWCIIYLAWEPSLASETFLSCLTSLI